jgi:fumigallin biosynthesis monooxygenase-like protein
MAEVLKGRYMADVSRLGDEVVVFVIGMRINKPRKVRLWWPVFNSMRAMLKYLEERPEKGLLAYRLSALPPFVVQYWRSFDDLERFARNVDDPHLEPWRRFNREIGKSGDVGIWHETYRVKTNDIETVYGNMPASGLGAASTLVPVRRGKDSAAARLGVTEEDRPALPGY